MLISSNKDNYEIFFDFPGKSLLPFLAIFSLANFLFKNNFGLNFCIFQPIFKFCVGHFTTNLVFNM